ncbi:MAG: GGDEF domain [Thermodesulfobacterium sp.]|uniref:diguanylate cyclase n=1 Tax=Candidatus Thermodesulfobacterium syntrophicum TaxID=3060442 RepID=A0AAE3P697_9BACT|nr:GGDEF domain [Candidatus Thermodesulfobacterium syntrophicum]
MHSSQKKLVYAYLKKNKTLKEWKDSLKSYLGKRYSLKTFYNLKRFFNAFLFKPPSITLYYYHKNEEGLEKLLEIRKSFNLTHIPLIILLDELNFNLLTSIADWTDDFLTLNDKIEEAYLRIEYALKKIDKISDNNPLTGLPGNTSISKEIEKVMSSSKKYAIAYVDLDNFKTYNDTYGFTRGDELIKSLARILINTVSEFSKDDYFVGHIGGDDFVFIVPLERVEQIAKEVIKRFDTFMPYFLDKKDLERGYFVSVNRLGQFSKIPLPSVSIAIVPVYKGKFKHIGEISARAAEIKNITKTLEGSSYFIDRRK